MRHFSRGVAGGLVLVALACGELRPTRVPMEKLSYLGSWDDARCLFVLLSGRLSAAGYFLG